MDSEKLREAFIDRYGLTPEEFQRIAELEAKKRVSEKIEKR